MLNLLRAAIAVLVGISVGLLLIGGIETVAHQRYPPPEALDLDDPEQAATWINVAPVGALIWVLIGWGIGTVGGAGVAGMLYARGPRVVSALVGLVLAALALGTMLIIRYPTWFWTAAAILFPLSTLSGMKAAATAKRLFWDR